MNKYDLFRCKACNQSGHVFLLSGYCPPCLDELREMVDEARGWELDDESAQSYAEYELADDEDEP